MVVLNLSKPRFGLPLVHFRLQKGEFQPQHFLRPFQRRQILLVQSADWLSPQQFLAPRGRLLRDP
jgi:hypothetical protein